MSAPVLSTERLILRFAAESDIPEIIRFYRENQDFLAPWSPLWPRDYLTVPFWRQRVARARLEFAEGSSVRFYIFLETMPERMLGTISFNQIHRGAAQYCILGYSLAKEAEGKGIMFESLQAALTYIFAELKLHRVMANYMPQNVRSGRLLEKLGFVVEGRARDYLLINGKWEDHILTSLTNPDWMSLT